MFERYAIPKLQTIDGEAATIIALGALGWTLADENRAERLIALTGLTPDDLRGRLAEPGVQAAVLGYLESHEPDLVACAESLQRPADDLVAARRVLEEGA